MGHRLLHFSPSYVIRRELPVEGKCEVSPDIPCAWQLIYDRLAALGQLDRLERIHPVQDWSTSQAGGPRKININT